MSDIALNVLNTVPVEESELGFYETIFAKDFDIAHASIALLAEIRGIHRGFFHGAPHFAEVTVSRPGF